MPDQNWMLSQGTVDARREEREHALGRHVDVLRPAAGYRLWVNADRTVLVRLWDSGRVELATREDSSHTWGPPVALTEERV